MKFAHIADTHIKNLKYHYEYRVIFEQLYETLREQKVDYIIHCGDIAHTKTQISPEFVEMCSEFFRNLASIAPTYVILGNHDGNLKNASRQDALSPIVTALGLPNLHLLKHAGETEIDDQFCLNVLSVFDTENWIPPTDTDKINIALYHGSISGVRTDTGWVMEHGENDVSIFDGFDFAFLGDIHKSNQILDLEGRIRYPGSTIQQNHGETDDKGLLIWDIKDRDTFTCEHIIFENPKPFTTIELTKKGRIPRNTDIPEGARLRIVANSKLPLSRMKRAVDIAKFRFKPESVTFLNRAASERASVGNMASEIMKEDLRDPGVQEKFVREYLAAYEADEATIQRVLSLNEKYNGIAQQEEEIARNINWRISSFEWDNLFNYGEDNKINFKALNGIVGIFGKNYSGKSSIIDALLYTLFNSTSKNERKNLNVINQHQESCVGKLELEIGNKQYHIQRSSEKYIKKLKGVETLEAKTDVLFASYDMATEQEEILNGTTRNGTDKKIRHVFGTLDDFLFSSMASQLDSLSFIKEGSTRRKEILAKFLDLEIFDNKYRLAKEDVSDYRGAIKRLEGINFEEEIGSVAGTLSTNEKTLTKQRNKCSSLEVKIEEDRTALTEAQASIDSIPAEIVDIVQVRESLASKNTQLSSTLSLIVEAEAETLRKQQSREKIKEFVKLIDIQEWRSRQETIDGFFEKIKETQALTRREGEELERNTKKSMLLDDIPCGTKFTSCKFIRDAYASVAKIPLSEERILELQNKVAEFEQSVTSLEPERVQDYIQKYETVITKDAVLTEEIAQLSIDAERNKTATERLRREIHELEGKQKEYDENRQAIESLEAVLRTKKELESRIKRNEIMLDNCGQKIMELYKLNGSLEQKSQSLKDQRAELKRLNEEYSAYDLFMRCMHSNGIAYDITKRKLPFINEEVAKVLANIVDFEVFFEDDGTRLNIFIKHPKHEPRPLEMGSGAEKTIASMAIRLALLSVSSLPKGDLFILDEPGTALDAENMEGFVRILDMIKNYYRVVLLISHMDTLKDVADMVINIDKKDGFAYVG